MKRAFVTTLTLSRRLIEATLFKLHSKCKLNAHESGKTLRKKGAQGFSFSWAWKGTNAWNQNFPIAFVDRRYLVKNYLGGLKICGIRQFYVVSKVISLLSFITWGEVCVNFGLARQAIKVWSFRRTVQFACLLSFSHQILQSVPNALLTVGIISVFWLQKLSFGIFYVGQIVGWFLLQTLIPTETFQL